MSNNRQDMGTFAPTMVRIAEGAQAPALSPEARLEAAHAKFMQTQPGTPAYDRAWEELQDALFINAK